MEGMVISTREEGKKGGEAMDELAKERGEKLQCLG